ncbi:MAG: histidine phosphatase family protein [Gammaproteobacteria bacterium]|nr:histidine phosphatase family protein [Gammaproteobacteria bacterium]
MKRLWVIRHAKTANPRGVEDFDRPLAERGEADATLVKAWLAAQAHPATYVVTSPALRARQTANAVKDAFGIADDALVEEPSLYMASPETIVDAARAVPDVIESLAIVGHNPGMTYVANLLGNAPSTGNLPTFGVVVFSFAGAWRDLAFGTCDWLAAITPKQLRP